MLTELLDMRGKSVLLTGAAGYLGYAMADTLAELGADLILVDQSYEELKQVSHELGERWEIDVQYHITDLENQQDRLSLLETIIHSGQNLDVLINNAAFVGDNRLSGWAEPLEMQSVQTWRRALEVNLTAVFELCQGLAPLLKNSGGCIVNIGSIYGELGPDWSLYKGTNMANPAAYAVSKGGVIQLTRWLATTLAPAIRVNSVSPGGIFRNQPESFVRQYEERTPLGRMASEDDFRGTIAYLASNLSSYMTGQNLRVDGGWGTW